jgi:hypothetical protein
MGMDILPPAATGAPLKPSQTPKKHADFDRSCLKHPYFTRIFPALRASKTSVSKQPSSGDISVLTKILLVTSAVFVLMATPAFAQEEAISSFNYTGGQDVFSIHSDQYGAGYAFMPVEPVSICSLGFSGYDVNRYSYVVSLFSADGKELVSATITTQNAYYNQTYYQDITPVTLNAGSVYYIGAMAPDNNYTWTGYEIGPASGTYNVDPEIAYLNGAAGFMGPGGSVPGISLGQVYAINSNFRFLTIPEPSVLALLACGAAGCFLRKK